MTAVMESKATEKNNSRLRLLDLTKVPAEDGVARLIERAVELHASDLFIVTNEQHVAVQVRLRGQVESVCILECEQGKRYLAHIRHQAGMDVSDFRRPHDGRWIYEADGRSVDLRINVIPTLHGDDMAIRLLDRDADLISLERLGMTARQLDVYRPLLDHPGGMILLTGPTGSGKTVTLYASLRHLNDGRRKLHTIEDPIEYAVPGLRQSQITPGIELGPHELLRGVLRQAADVVMIGEVRDEPTASTAVGAANTGTLVLSTIHASSAAGVVQSLRGYGIAAPFIASSIRAALGQRLLRTLCPSCQDISDDGHAPDVQRMMEEIKAFLPSASLTPRYVAHGCEHCQHTGYAGCTAVYEIMPITDAIRDLILDGRATREIHARAVEEGMLTLRQAALLKVAQGRTTMEEVRRAVPNIPLAA
jgi:type II secretory ATPase GspE/PulE/Tfp pilus assembly ATPase PilB-like protein